MYNQYNPEADVSFLSIENYIAIFKSFLYSEKISKGSIRSYLSDVRYFLSWYFLFLKSNHLQPESLISDINSFLKLINQKILDAYKVFQIEKNIPFKTINRRFSSLRRFGSFCISQNWLCSNVFDTLKNISLNPSLPEDKHHLGEFRIELWKKGASKSTVKNYLADVRQFLLWQERFN